MSKYHRKIMNLTLFVLSMNVFSSYSMEKETDTAQNTLSDCTDRVEQFISILADTIVYEKSPTGQNEAVSQGFYFSPHLRQRALNNYKANSTEERKVLSLENSGILAIPTKIIKLKGCINILDLSNNPRLRNLPASLVAFESEKDFSLRIQNTPLMEKTGKAVLTSHDIKKMFTAKTDCISRVGTFLDQLIKLNPQMLKSHALLDSNATTDLEKINYIRDKITKYYIDSLSLVQEPKLSLWSLDIQKLPKEIVNLKGCINAINLTNNIHLSLSSFPSEAAELGTNVKVVITRTPLQTIFGVTEKDLVEIVSEKQLRETGEFSSMALASEQGMTDREGITLPTELRQQILNSMIAKEAAEKQAREKKDGKS